MTEMVKAKLNGKYEIILPKHRADREEWYMDKGWERKRLDSIHYHLSMYENSGEKPTMYYIGAEEGEMPALCQMWGANVVMFEPNERVWPNIKAIWEANELDNPLLCFVGFAGNRDHRIIDGWDIAWPECTKGEVISDHGFKSLSDKEDIPQIRIDTLVIDEDFYAPTGISIDVEGAEWEVLQGAEQTLRKHHPKIWLSLHPEFLFDKYQKYSYEVRRWLIDMGYEEELLAYDHEAHFFYEWQT